MTQGSKEKMAGQWRSLRKQDILDIRLGEALDQSYSGLSELLQ
jgi:hypothetical protein